LNPPEQIRVIKKIITHGASEAYEARCDASGKPAVAGLVMWSGRERWLIGKAARAVGRKSLQIGLDWLCDEKGDED
jgi:hypothetical protein